MNFFGLPPIFIAVFLVISVKFSDKSFKVFPDSKLVVENPRGLDRDSLCRH